MYIGNSFYFSDKSISNSMRQAKFDDENTENPTDEKPLSGFRRFLKFKDSMLEKQSESLENSLDLKISKAEQENKYIEDQISAIEEQMDSEVQESEIKYPDNDAFLINRMLDSEVQESEIEFK